MAKIKQIAKKSLRATSAKHSTSKGEKPKAPSKKRRKLKAGEGWVGTVRNHVVQSKETFIEVLPESVRMSILWEDDCITPEPMTNILSADAHLDEYYGTFYTKALTKTFTENFIKFAECTEMRREDAAFLAFSTDRLWKENATVTDVIRDADGCWYASLSWMGREEKRLKIEEVRNICPGILLDYFLKNKGSEETYKKP